MEIKQIPLSLVHPSPMNPRKTFDEGELKELAENIRQQGLLQPITVRPVKHPANEFGDRPDKYEIVCGERRYRAFLILNEGIGMDAIVNPWAEISAIVREMSDEDAFDAMITENLQRKDVDPIEEAFAFGQLLKKGDTAQDIALRFGKSVRFVQDRVKLNSLVPELVKTLKEGKMPISAAMIICKVTDEQQRAYYKQWKDNYGGFTTSNASTFVKSLFLDLSIAVWGKKPEFAGGCGTTCAECQCNTANHGCLFYEMNNTKGRCTDEEKFIAKTVAYVEDYLRSVDGTLVKSGEPLTMGKTVVAVSEYDDGSADRVKIKKAVKDKVKELGYEIVEPYNQFKSKCFYDFKDERTQELLKKGDCYHVLQLGFYSQIRIEDQAWYVKSDDIATNSDGNGTPLKVSGLVRNYEDDKNSLPLNRVVAGCKAIGGHGDIKDLKELDQSEKILAVSLMLDGDKKLCAKLLGSTPKSKEITDYVENHPDMWPFIIRSWMKRALADGIDSMSVNEVMLLATPFVERLGELWCPEEYRKSQEKVDAKFHKTEKKITAQLKELGYTLDGKKIEESQPEPSPIEKQFRMMKKDHPDAIILFRVGDFYEAIHEDAEEVSKILSLTLANRGKTKLTGFPHHALDTYVPRLIKAGKRVAVCETIPDAKK